MDIARHALKWDRLGPVLIILLTCGCDRDPSPTQAPTAEPVVDIPLNPGAAAATETTWQTGAQQIQMCADNNRVLRQAISDFLANPSEEGLQQSRSQWRQAHNHFIATSLFLSLAENNPGLFGSLAQYQYALDGHPIQPGFIDYFDVYQHSGIVNDIAITLSAESLRQQHGITDVSDVSIGFHAMEYLLWGETGTRPVDDFTAVNQVSAEQQQQGLRVVDLPNNRRRVYLQLLAEMLFDDCNRLYSAWTDPSANLAPQYQALQIPSRLSLWRAIVAAELHALHSELVSAEAAQDSESNQDSETEPLSANHNLFAKQNAGVIAGRLSGLQAVLFGPSREKEAEQDAAKDADEDTDTTLKLAVILFDPAFADTLAAEFNAAMDEVSKLDSLPTQAPWLTSLSEQLLAALTHLNPNALPDPAIDGGDSNETDPAEASR